MTPEDIKNCETSLRELFDSIDTDNSGLLSRAEFKIFLGELHISFSHKRWRQIFREIDRNYDDQISFDELFLFLFPDHDEALSRELRRLKIVGDRVRTHGLLHGHHRDDYIEEISPDAQSNNSSPAKAPGDIEVMSASGSYKLLGHKITPEDLP